MKSIYKIIIVTVIILAAGFSFYFLKDNKKTDIAVGRSSSASVSSKADWDLGTLVNIDTTTFEGTAQIDDETVTKEYLNIGDYTYSITASVEPNKENPVTGGAWDATWYCTDTWEVYSGAKEWVIDFGEEIENFYSEASYASPAASAFPGISYSTDGVNWTNMTNVGEGQPYECLDPAFNFYDPAGEDCAFHEGGAKVTTLDMGTARYVKITNTNGYTDWWGDPGLCGDVPYTLWDFKIFTESATGTHTTASTQIDGQESETERDVIEWTSFSPSESEPVNTTVRYSFRTSEDGTNWSGWSSSYDYNGSAIDLTSLDPSRYLQVKATLTTVDAGAIPSISSYTVNFHNNLKPNKPTAQTAVVGD